MSLTDMWHRLTAASKEKLIQYSTKLAEKGYDLNTIVIRVANYFAIDHQMAGHFVKQGFKLAFGMNPKKWPIEKYKKNPVKIYDQLIEIKAKKGKGSLWPGERFKHPFKSKSKAAIYGNKDGSLTIKSKTGKRLWDNFDYDREDYEK